MHRRRVTRFGRLTADELINLWNSFHLEHAEAEVAAYGYDAIDVIRARRWIRRGRRRNEHWDTSDRRPR